MVHAGADGVKKMIITEKQILMLLNIAFHVGRELSDRLNPEPVMYLYDQILNQQSNELIEVK